MLYLFLFSYCWFRYAFQSILLIIDFILHQLHSAKTSFSQNINYFKIIYRILSLLLLLMIMNVRGAFFYFWSSIEMFISIFNNNWFSALKFSFVFDFSCCIIKCSKFADSYIWVCVHFLLITTIVMQRMISQWKISLFFFDLNRRIVNIMLILYLRLWQMKFIYLFL